MTEPEIIHCQQTLSPTDDCCAGESTCEAAAAYIHRESGAALCEVHERNARIFGGVKLGEWTVGKTTVSYPDGWTHVDDGAPLIVDDPQASVAPAQPGAAPVLEVSRGTVRPSGLIIP